jgi:uncharacterized protein YbjT (DUF2867 family)
MRTYLTSAVNRRQSRSVTLLVTGATGLVGSNACRLASDQGFGVRAFVRPGADGVTPHVERAASTNRDTALGVSAPSQTRT